MNPAEPIKPTGRFAQALTPVKRVLMLGINAWPLGHCLLIVALLYFPWAVLGWRICAALGMLYLLPPLFARVLRLLRPIEEGHIPVGSAGFFIWWALFSLQILYTRLPFLEEGLRLLPGVYSLWLRLWGAKIGRLTYWAAGIQILDRSFVRIGDDVIFGAGVRINPHILSTNTEGRLELVLATVEIGDRALVGGYSLLSSGTVIGADECTRALLFSPPFSRWEKGGRRPNSFPAA